MSNEEYTRNMDLIASAFRSFVMVASALEDRELGIMEQTLERAGSVGFLFIPGIEFAAAMENVGKQRKLLKFVRQARALRKELEGNRNG